MPSGQHRGGFQVFDINNPKDPVNSGYIWLPLEFDGEGKPAITWRNTWQLDDLRTIRK